MELLGILKRESRIRPGVLMLLTAISALATVVIIAAVSVAAESAAKGTVSLRMAGIFVVATALYAVAQKSLMASFAVELEGVIHRIRQSLFAGIRETDLLTLKRVGRGPLFAAITQNTQTISRNLPLVVLGTQQLALVAFICLYLAFLSLPAFVLAAGFCAVIVSVHLTRMKALGIATDHAMADERRLFEGLDGLLHGLKEVRMSARRSDAQVADLAAVSAQARDTRSLLKARWAREFALIQLAFYVLVGLMVFVVPGISVDFHEVAFSGTMAALFLVGPVGTVATAIPAVDEAERSLQAIRAVASSLRDEFSGDAQGAPAELAEPLTELTLDAVRFAYPAAEGVIGFSVGPVSARFRTGQITFITGGNGSGKSTLMMLLTALIPAHGGAVLVNGQPLGQVGVQAWRNCISAVLADYHLFSRLYGVEGQALGRLAEYLHRFEMADKVGFADGAFTTLELSSGQRKRLALVSALLEDKPVLILDEWAADQDPHFRSVFYEEILPSLRAEGKMVICVTHDDRWFGLADQVLHMDEGQLEAGSMR
jgi:putative pyoverdin transport system ATP-binding/permease protein